MTGAAHESPQAGKPAAAAQPASPLTELNAPRLNEIRPAQVQLWTALSRRNWQGADAATIALCRASAKQPELSAAALSAPHPKTGIAPIHYYTSFGAPNVLLEKTVKAGADLSATTTVGRRDGSLRVGGCTALHIAFANRAYEKAAILMKAGHPLRVLNNNNEDPILMMLKNGRANRIEEAAAVPLVRQYLELGGFVGDRGADGSLALFEAIQSEYWQIADVLLREHLGPNYPTNSVPIRKSEVQSSALFTSLRHKEPGELVQALAELGKKAVSEELWPTPPEQMQWIKILLDYVPDIDNLKDEQAWLPMQRILKELKGQEHLFDRAVQSALVNARMDRKPPPAELTPLMVDVYAALGIIESFEAVPPTLLHLMASGNAPIELIGDAISLGADLNAQASTRPRSAHQFIDGQTVAHHAAKGGDEKLLALCMQRNADLNIQNGNGETVLVAYLRNLSRQVHPVTVGALLRAGADPTIKDASGTNAYDLVARAGHGQLLQIMQRMVSATEHPVSEKRYTIFRNGEPVDVDEFDLLNEVALLSASRGHSISGSILESLVESGEIEKLITEMLTGGVSDPSDLASLLDDAELDAFDDGDIPLDPGPGLEDIVIHIHDDIADIRSRQRTPWYLLPDANIYHAYLYLKAVKEIGERNDGPEHAFTKLLPHLLFSYDIEKSHGLAQQLERTMDSLRRRSGEKNHHPNAVELMALINHPRDKERSRRTLGALTSSLTSITHFAGVGKRTTGSIAQLWGNIGALCFSFPFWRFDAERIRGIDDAGKPTIELPSLFERWGAQAWAPDFRDRNPVFGPSFSVLPGSKLAKAIAIRSNRVGDHKFDPDTFVELHRGCIVISHPSRGTLVVRNSSTVFGRDLLSEPALYSTSGVRSTGNMFGFSQLQLARITPEFLKDNDFMSILDYELYGEGRYRHRYGDGHTGKSLDRLSDIEALVDSFLAVKQDFARYKFDSVRKTAWRDNPKTGNKELVGGYQSPGFQAVVDYLECRHRDREIDLITNGETKLILPDLAFVNPYFPPWSPYARMAVDGDMLQSLRKLADGERPTKAEMEDSQLYEFLTVGFENDAELVLLSPLGGRGDGSLK